jgi:hypothetical protein
LVLVAVESVGYSRGGYNSAFWKLPMDDKLDHISQHQWAWWWVSIWELVGLYLLTAGMFGLTGLLNAAGGATVPFVALGGYVIAVFAWVFGLIVQASAMSIAATQRTESKQTPSWIHPLWQAGYVAEAVWIIGANVAYVGFGVAILQTNILAPWTGWAVAAGGVLIAGAVVIFRAGFPQLAILIPAFLGVALIIKDL